MVVDSSALVAIFRQENEAPAFITLIDQSEIALISVVTVVETMSVLCGRRIGATREQVERLVAKLGLSAEAVDEPQQKLAIDALLAFGKGRHPAKLNFGDCFAYALAKSRNLPLLFKGDDFARTDIVPAWRP
ncbi:MAG TPA: type II toxin-antitoxin system VapC family toxin [Beijerinckiaceae bacterium]|jgi:ribonuclease VapC